MVRRRNPRGSRQGDEPGATTSGAALGAGIGFAFGDVVRGMTTILGALIGAFIGAAVAVPGAWAQPPLAAIGFLYISPSPVGNGGTATVKPSDPCPPPSAATQPFAVVTDSGPELAGMPERLASVPVAGDGSWSATVRLSGPGAHSLQAFCLSGPQAEGAYAVYEPTFVDVVPRSVGFWAAQAARAAPRAAGDAPDYSPLAPPVMPVAPVVGVAANPTSGLGYWTVGGDGGVYTFGHSQFYGSAGDIRLAARAVGMAVTTSGHGYWVAAADGGVFTYGDAHYYGSGAADGLDRSPVVGIAPTGLHSALGYLLAHADGAVVAYTAAGVSEPTGPMPLNAPIVGIASTPSENGYWLAASDGGVFAFGDAAFAGSLGGGHLNAPIVGIASRVDGGYWLLGRDGGVFCFGGAPFLGSFVGTGTSFTAIAATPDPTAP
jgi:hypothetical protein